MSQSTNNNIASIVVISVGLILLLIGMSTTSWSTSGDFYSRGLFRNCFKALGIKKCVSTPKALLKKNQAWAQTGVTFALLGGIAALGIAVANMVFLTLTMKMDLLATLASLASFFSLICVAMAAVVWVAAVHDSNTSSIGYSLIIAVLGGIIISCGGSLVNVPR